MINYGARDSDSKRSPPKQPQPRCPSRRPPACRLRSGRGSAGPGPGLLLLRQAGTNPEMRPWPALRGWLRVSSDVPGFLSEEEPGVWVSGLLSTHTHAPTSPTASQTLSLRFCLRPPPCRVARNAVSEHGF